MSVPVLAFFNNKGGLGKTSLAYHLAWMLTELDRRILAVDLDPQANLTAAFLDDDRLIELWEERRDAANTIFRCLRRLTEVGDIMPAELVAIRQNLALIPGDLALSSFEDPLSAEWSASLGDQNLIRPFRVLTAFWQTMQEAAARADAELIIVDVGPNLGAINRSALISADMVLIPIAADLFSLQGLKSLGPALTNWRHLWERRLDHWPDSAFPLPKGRMRPIGYVAQQHGVRLSRPVKSHDRWLNRMPAEYRRSVLGLVSDDVPRLDSDPECLALLKHFHSLLPMAMEARKPLFLLRSADGAIGAHANAVGQAYREYEILAKTILARAGL